MHQLIKWAAVPALAIALLLTADSQQAKAQFGINVGFGSFGYGPGYGAGFGPSFGPGYGRPGGFSNVNRYSGLQYGSGFNRQFNNSFRASSYAFPSYRSSYYRAPVQLYSVPVRPVYGRGGRVCY